MVSDELRSIIDALSKQGKMNFLDAASEDEIASFQKAQNITLPKQFKEWLLFCDGGECFLPAGVQFYGVAHKPLIDATDNDRPSDDYVIIGALASGDPILCEKDTERISIFNHEAGRIETDEIYDDFYAFLKNLPEILGIGG